MFFLNFFHYHSRQPPSKNIKITPREPSAPPYSNSEEHSPNFTGGKRKPKSKPKPKSKSKSKPKSKSKSKSKV